MVQIWEQGEGKANSFLSLCKAPARREQAQRGGRAPGPPGMLGGRDQMEMGDAERKEEKQAQGTAKHK